MVNSYFYAGYNIGVRRRRGFVPDLDTEFKLRRRASGGGLRVPSLWASGKRGSRARDWVLTTLALSRHIVPGSGSALLFRFRSMFIVLSSSSSRQRQRASAMASAGGGAWHRRNLSLCESVVIDVFLELDLSFFLSFRQT